MKLKALVFFNLLGLVLCGQNVAVLDHYTTIGESSPPKDFLCITNEVDVAGKIKVGRLIGFCRNSGKSTIADLYNSFYKKANEMGADAMKIDSIKVYDTDSVFVEGTLYLLGAMGLEQADNYYPQNKIYILGDLDLKFGEIRKVNLNDDKLRLPPLGLISYQNSIGLICSVSKGGFFGSWMKIKGAPDKKPVYLTLGGATVSPAVWPGGGVGVSFSAGNLTPVNRGLGYFTVSILEKLKIEAYQI